MGGGDPYPAEQEFLLSPFQRLSISPDGLTFKPTLFSPSSALPPPQTLPRAPPQAGKANPQHFYIDLANCSNLSITIAPSSDLCKVILCRDHDKGKAAMGTSITLPRLAVAVQSEYNWPALKPGYMHVKIKRWDGREFFIHPVKRSNKLQKLMDSYCDAESVDLKSVRFVFNGRTLDGGETPEQIGMEDGAEINVLQVQ